LSFTFHATGHPAVLSAHPSTIEITKEKRLSARGDCIVAVNSSIGPADLPRDLRTALSREEAKVQLSLAVDEFEFIVKGDGGPRLTLPHPTDFVMRRSGFISDRTLMIHADKAACDLPRDMVKLLRDPATKVTIRLSARTVM